MDCGHELAIRFVTGEQFVAHPVPNAEPGLTSGQVHRAVEP